MAKKRKNNEPPPKRLTVVENKTVYILQQNLKREFGEQELTSALITKMRKYTTEYLSEYPEQFRLKIKIDADPVNKSKIRIIIVKHDEKEKK